MKIFYAGLLAAFFIACAEPGVELAKDAGETMRDSGVVLVEDAGALLEDAAQAVLDAGTDASDASAQELDGLPRPHWIVRDKNGETVDLVVSPRPALERFTTARSDCILVEYAGQREIQLTYLLSTGKIVDNCVAKASISTWRDTNAVYTDAACNKPAGLTAGLLLDVANHWHYTDGTPQHYNAFYQWTGSACAQVSPAGGVDLWSYKQAPGDVESLLPDAPYALELVY